MDIVSNLRQSVTLLWNFSFALFGPRLPGSKIVDEFEFLQTSKFLSNQKEKSKSFVSRVEGIACVSIGDYFGPWNGFSPQVQFIEFYWGNIFPNQAQIRNEMQKLFQFRGFKMYLFLLSKFLKFPDRFLLIVLHA